MCGAPFFFVVFSLPSSVRLPFFLFTEDEWARRNIIEVGIKRREGRRTAWIVGSLCILYPYQSPSSSFGVRARGRSRCILFLSCWTAISPFPFLMAAGVA